MDPPTQLFLTEKVLVEALELNRAIAANTDLMLDHEIGQFPSVDQDDALGQMFHIVPRRLAEGRGGDENTLAGAQADQAADETIDVWTTDLVGWCIAFCLHVDAIKPKPILVDDPVHAAIARAAQLGRSVLVAAAIAHGHQQVDDKLLKKGRAVFEDPLQELVTQPVSEA